MVYNNIQMDPKKSTIQVPTIAGDRSNEAPILLVDPKKAGAVAEEILLRNEERKRLGFEGIGFYIRERFFG